MSSPEVKRPDVKRPGVNVSPGVNVAPESEQLRFTRRHFVGALGIAAAGAAVPGAVADALGVGAAVRPEVTPSNVPASPVAAGPAHTAAGSATTAAPAGSGTLVVLTLYGGNDGLNTVVPYADSAYLGGRGGLAYNAGEVLQLDAAWGLNPSMVGIKRLWDAKRVAIVRGVGYPNPNRSHFRSMDIWQTGVPDGFEATGWLGRWHDATGADPLRMVSIGPSLPRAMAGTKGGGAALPTGQLTLPGGASLATAFAELHRSGAGAELGTLGARLGATGADLLRVQASFGPLLNGITSGSGGTSLEGGATANGEARSELDDQLDEVAALVKGGAPTRVFHVSLGGFDTHVTERDQHARLWLAVDHAVTRFFDGLAGNTRGDAITLLVYSEFGRRVAANASEGTDHGTAAPSLVIGPQVKGGFYGDAPSLTDLDQGDLKFTTDFRSVYATLLASVLGIDPAAVLGKSFAPVPFL